MFIVRAERTFDNKAKIWAAKGSNEAERELRSFLMRPEVTTFNTSVENLIKIDRLRIQVEIQ